MGQSILPEELESETIEHMSPGDEAYTLPWAMWVDLERRLWINPHYPAEREAFGTVSMRIRRERDHVVVFKATIGDHRYQPTAQPGFVGFDGQGLPVVLR